VKPAALSLGPSEHTLIELKDVLSKLLFLQPEELVMVDVEIVESFLHKAGTWHERGRVGRERRQGEQRVLGSSSNDAKVFGEGGGYRVNLLGSLLVGKDFHVGGRTQGVRDVLLKRSHTGWGGSDLKS
jgi:hypothetical protein